MFRDLPLSSQTIGKLTLNIVPSSGSRYESQFHLTNYMNVCYRPKRSFGQGNIFTPVCHSVHRGEYLTRYPPPRTRYTPPDQEPPRDQVHPTPPQTRYPPGSGTPPDQVHPPGPGTPQIRYTPLGPGTPPWIRYTPRDQVHTALGPGTPPPDQVHTPRAANSGILSTIGRYASYWNAFLFIYGIIE